SCFRFRPATAPRIWHSHKYVNSSFYPVGADSVWAPGRRLIHIRTGWVGWPRQRGVDQAAAACRGGSGLQVARHQEGFGGLVPRGFRLALDHPLEALLEGLHDLRKSAAVEGLDDQRPIGLEVIAGEVQGQLANMLDASRIGDTDPGQVGGHVGNYKTYRLATHHFLQLLQNRLVAEVALDEFHPGDGFHGQQIQGDDAAIDHPAGAGQAFARHLRPTAGSRPQVDHDVAPAHQFFGVEDLDQLEGGPGAVALLLRHLHIGIVDVLVYPVFREFLLGHYRTIPRMPILELTSRERSDLRS